jgi:hypothetical protein
VQRDDIGIVLALAALLLLSTGVALTAAAAGQLTQSDPLREFRAAARPKIHDSKRGRPLFVVRDFYPGDVARSHVRIGNRSRVRCVLYLRPTGLRNTPPNQPRLADALWLRIWWKRADGRTRVVWTGRLSRFHRVRACTLRPGQSHLFRFSVRFGARQVHPRGFASLMGHTAHFGLHWSLAPRR